MKSFIKSNDGVIAVEFGLLAPVILIMFLIISAGGFIVISAVQLQNAVEAGALFAINNAGAPTATIKSVVQSATGLSNVVVADPTFHYECADGTQMSAGSTCTDQSVLAKYISITATKSVDTVVIFPGIANPFTLTRKSVMRVQ